jgi:hypothetical protein
MTSAGAAVRNLWTVLVHASVRRFTIPTARREHRNCGTLPDPGA